MKKLYHFKAFFLSIPTYISQLLAFTAPTLSTHNNAGNHEAMTNHVHQHHLPPVADQHNLGWAMMIIGFCLPSAVEISLQSLQTSQLPPIFQFFCLAIIFSLTLLFLSKFISSRFPKTAQVLEWFGVFIAVTICIICTRV
ncbi:hypothetical protein Patl1_27211 [Pistacia atlantica]|uniref:Uncharacterized protein n=1 Tax=Pistacia atlantica TaxID=434234 RepID=A0ACC1BE76_9ROSI|nr:hypothetical protein Patl1_27211 [Pistacia atlantica]